MANRRVRVPVAKTARMVARTGAVLLIAAVWLTAGAPARADFAAGLAAFDAGDYATALAEWHPLAEAGDVGAQVAIAGMYLSGQGTAADLREAIRWYRLAAEAGDPVAQLNLGDLLGRGAGLRRDPVEAYVWLSLAAGQGRRWAARRRDEIAAGMTPDQIAEAERRIADRRAAQ